MKNNRCKLEPVLGLPETYKRCDTCGRVYWVGDDGPYFQRECSGFRKTKTRAGEHEMISVFDTYTYTCIKCGVELSSAVVADKAGRGELESGALWSEIVGACTWPHDIYPWDKVKDLARGEGSKA